MRMLSIVLLLAISMARGTFCLSSRRVFISQFAAAIMSAEGGAGDAYNEDESDKEVADYAAEKEGSWLDGFELAKDQNSCYPAAFDEYDAGDDDENVHSNLINDDDDDNNDEDDDYEGLDYLQLHPLLQIPCGISLAREKESSPSKPSKFLQSFFSLPNQQQQQQQTTTTSSSGGNNNNNNNMMIHQQQHQPVQAFLDTGAQRTVMSWEAAAKLGFLLPHLDRRYAGRAAGVGSCAVLGRIPAGVALLNLGGETTVPSPSITIIESTGTKGVDFLLGLDFLREQQAVIDLRNEELQIQVNDEDFSIPFIRPRGFLTTIDTDDDDNNGDGEVDMSGM